MVGALCLLVSLALKPHDVGFIWLYFLLAGGVHRKRALQIMAMSALLCLVSVLWISSVSPHWTREWHSNLAALEAHGGLNDPGPDSQLSRTAGMVIDLQAAVSIFRDDPKTYNPVTYIVCGALLLVWSYKTLKSGFSQTGAWLSLATVAPLTMLVTYHRPHDAKLLLLTVPACATLCAEGGLIGSFSVAVNSAGILLTGDIPLVFFTTIANDLHVAPVGLTGKTMTLVLTRPASVVLLVMASFNLWIYMRHADEKMAVKRKPVVRAEQLVSSSRIHKVPTMR
jgi:hypothetical protein